jgi:acyl-CoA hydrolase
LGNPKVLPPETPSGTLPALTPDTSQQQLIIPAMPNVLNILGHVKAGYVLKMIDIGAVLPLLRHLGPGFGVVTAGVDRTNFIQPIRRWELITLTNRLTQVWTSSSEVEVTITATSFRSGETRHIATANLVLVGLDHRRKKCVMPPLTCTTPADLIRQQAANKRKQARLTDAQQTDTEWPIDPATDDPVCIEQPMTLSEANLFNQVFGGVILEIMETAGRTAAKRHVLGGAIEGVRLDRMSFITPAFIGETIRAYGVITHTSLTSMEVQVEVFAFNDRLPTPRKIAQAFFVYVGLDPDGVPSVVPTWQPATPTQEQRTIAAEDRYQQRKLDRTPLAN